MTKLSLAERDSFLGWPFYRPALSSYLFPSLSSFFDDIPSYEYKDGKLSVSLPGFKKNQVTVEVRNGSILYVSAKNDKQTLSHSFDLGDDIEPSNTRARLEDGVLTVDIQRLVRQYPEKTVISIE